MKLTNKFGIPQTFVNVLKRPHYSSGGAHLSVTQLINSPKIVALSRRFQDELEQDVSEMIWSLFGTAVHGVLEHGKDDHHLVEERLHAEVDGYKISGAIDLQVVQPEGICIRDYKVTSVWAVMNDKIEWEQQLNIYAWLVETVKKKPIHDLAIVAIIRDWSRRDAATKEGYPPAPIKELPITLWPQEEREAFIKERIHAHATCEFEIESDGELPDCTPVEMWEKPTSWAVKKEGAARAKSVHYSEQDAERALEKLGKGYAIEVRPGERTRCANFCQVSQYCQQWRDYQESKDVSK